MQPETKFESYDPRFDALLRPDSTLLWHCAGSAWAEGPVYFAEGDYLLWSDTNNDIMWRWSDAEGQSVFRQPSHHSNGNTRDREGRLVTCEHGRRRVSRTEPDGEVITLVDRYRGKPLNSPNDVVVKSDGTVWFTDPPYGILSDREGHKADQEQLGCYVFRFDPRSDELTVVADDRDKPNGLAFSPDESILYVGDTGRSHDPGGWHHIFAYDVIGGERLANRRVFAEVEPGNPDGFRLDRHGNLFTSSGDSVQVYSPAGELLGKIMVPEASANCTFGGPGRDRLFITATTSLYSIVLNTRGVQSP